MAELVERWPLIVGDGIARNAWPARIARDGTVHVNTADSVWSFELGHRAAEIAERARRAEGALRARARFRKPDAVPVENRVEVSPEDDERARAIASTIADENLRESVQKAVTLSLARGRRNRQI